MADRTIYFGEDMGGYGITGATRDELDYQIEDETQNTTSEGADGVSIGGLFLAGLASAIGLVIGESGLGLEFEDVDLTIAEAAHRLVAGRRRDASVQQGNTAAGQRPRRPRAYDRGSRTCARGPSPQR